MRWSKRWVGILACLAIGFYLKAQPALASAQLRNLHGKIQPYSAITQKDSLVLICFWSIGSEPSITALNAINANYEHWQSAVNFRLMIVSIDEGKALSKVRPLVNMNEWTFDVYTDINGDLRKALDANNLPESMIIKNGKLVYQQSGYESGSENYLFQKILTLSNSPGKR
ncbi:MAG: peroxiredoxin family protein [Chitinophagales bacterium]